MKDIIKDFLFEDINLIIDVDDENNLLVLLDCMGKLGFELDEIMWETYKHSKSTFVTIDCKYSKFSKLETFLDRSGLDLVFDERINNYCRLV